MPEGPDDITLAELRKLMAQNAKAIERLRAMLERLEYALAAASQHKPPAAPEGDSTRSENGDPSSN